MARKPTETTNIETKETNVESNTIEENIVTEVKTEKEIVKKIVSKVIKFTEDTYVTLKNNVCGTLYYLNKRTGDNYEWDKYGATQDVKISDLREMKSSQRNFLTKSKFSIIDIPDIEGATSEDVINYLGLTQYFKEDLCPDLDNVIFNWTVDDILAKVPQISNGSKETLTVLCNTYIENGTLDSRKKISA